jgi:hypothetical protein
VPNLNEWSDLKSSARAFRVRRGEVEPFWSSYRPVREAGRGAKASEESAWLR